tara:strand:+ start:6651 stop:6899 length:249 start_codon:yes stop_codon:yes gene_type:complete
MPKFLTPDMPDFYNVVEVQGPGGRIKVNAGDVEKYKARGFKVVGEGRKGKAPEPTELEKRAKAESEAEAEAAEKKASELKKR